MIAVYDGLPPNFRSFFQPCANDLVLLGSNSVHVENCIDHTHTILCAKIAFLTSDQEAKLHSTNLAGYNARFGCFYCKIPGKLCNNNHIYFPHHQTPSYPRSCDREEIEFYLNSRIYGNVIEMFRNLTDLGVKGLPALLELQEKIGTLCFDVYHSNTIDIMHCIFLGTLKHMMKCWILNKHGIAAQLGCNLKERVTEIDSTMSNCSACFPEEISYKISSIKNFSQWKASQYMYFFFISGPGMELLKTRSN